MPVGPIIFSWTYRCGSQAASVDGSSIDTPVRVRQTERNLPQAEL